MQDHSSGAQHAQQQQQSCTGTLSCTPPAQFVTGTACCPAHHQHTLSRVLHAVLQADNILMSEAGEVVLADFGVGARMRAVSMVNLDMQAVMATTFVGTPCWMAPEVMQQSAGG